MQSKHYLIHWNIQGSTRNKQDSFKAIIHNANQRKFSIIYCLNEVNNDYIKHKQPNVFLQGFDENVSGSIKKSNIIVCLNNVEHFPNEDTEVKYIINRSSSFRYRVVKATLRLGGKRISILTFHSPAGSVENGNISGSKVKAKFYAKMLSIIQKEKPDIITMDANEPKKHSLKIANWDCHDNSAKNKNIIEAEVTFNYIDKHFNRVRTGPTYKKKHYDHIFFRKEGVKLIQNNDLDDLVKLHKSDHKPIVVEIVF
jgi:exonuclease III